MENGCENPFAFCNTKYKYWLSSGHCNRSCTTTTTALVGWCETALSPATPRNYWETSQRERGPNLQDNLFEEFGLSDNYTERKPDRAPKGQKILATSWMVVLLGKGCEWLYRKGCYLVNLANFDRRWRLLWARWRIARVRQRMYLNTLPPTDPPTQD